MIQQELNGAALRMLAGALALSCGALLYAISVWDDAATDRAYVEAAKRAAIAERTGALAAEEARTRAWVPMPFAMPEPRFMNMQERFMGRGIAAPPVPRGGAESGGGLKDGVR
ncbi:hypothetical protein HMPREF9946_00949 [Acetobacteraceae bacterium AT-5844]|nr:hypothetical protein HMPREF9946_00949 [Acetobacteraceae bacterium AT-5844]